jgi:adenine-specific DNA-methyltransferase
MMYPRLVLARNLLTQDGMIFVSIDDNEVHNLRAILDEIFGEHNFVATFKWNKTSKAPTLSKLVRNKYEYVLAYTRGHAARLRGVDSYNTAAPLLNSGNAKSEVRFAEGTLGCLLADGTYPAGLYGDPDRGVVLLDALEVKNQKNVLPVRMKARFKWSQSTVEERLASGIEIFIKTSKLSTIYYSLSSGADKFIAPADIINPEEVQVKRNDDAFAALKDLFGGRVVFEYSKPVSLLKFFVRMIPENDFIVLDFFSGSGTTAHAVMELNAEDGGRRRHIQVQLPEPVEDDSELRSLGLSTIAAIARRRIELAGEKIRAESESQSMDVGFRAYRLGCSNFRTVTELGDGELFAMNEKTLRAETADRYAIAAEIFLKEGVALDAPWIEHEFGDATAQLSGGVAVVSGQKLANDVVQQVFDLAPRVAVFLEDDLAGKDALKANAFTNARNRGITMKTV